MPNIRMRFPNFKFKAFTLSYDDGVVQDIRLVQMLEKYAVKGTFNLNSGLFGKGRRMPADNLKELYKNQEIAVHGYKHLSLQGLDSGIAVNDIITDRKELETLFSRIIKGMAYAYGTYDETVKNALKACGIVYSRTTYNVDDFSLPKDWLEWHATCHHANPKLMEYAEKFLALEEKPLQFPKLFFVWGHSYEFDYDQPNNNWGVIEKFAEYMGGREDIWYATNIEIYDYIAAYHQLIFSMDYTRVYNPTCTTLYFKTGKGLYTVRPGETAIFDF